MLTCHKCGHPASESNARYCARCGELLPAPTLKFEPETGPRIRGILILAAIAICLCPLLNLLLFVGGHEGGCAAFFQNLLKGAPAAFSLGAYAKTSTLVLLVLSVLVAVLFVARKTKAPLACLLLFALYAIDNLVLALWMQNTSYAQYEIVSMVTAKFLFWGVLAYFWWGYISVSERVRAIFVY
jgi:hypothetical protein